MWGMKVRRRGLCLSSRRLKAKGSVRSRAGSCLRVSPPAPLSHTGKLSFLWVLREDGEELSLGPPGHTFPAHSCPRDVVAFPVWPSVSSVPWNRAVFLERKHLWFIPQGNAYGTVRALQGEGVSCAQVGTM